MDIARRTYLAFVTLVGCWSVGIVLAPVLSSALPGLSSLLYQVYEPICHQIDGRSLHIGGDKLAVCARCSSIYFAFFTSLLLFPFLRRFETQALPHRAWIVLALAPMALDVAFSVVGIHDSSLLTRSLSGAMFGLILPFYLTPVLTEAVAQLRDQLISRGGLSHVRETQ